jgi:hypothetical protein
MSMNEVESLPAHPGRDGDPRLQVVDRIRPALEGEYVDIDTFGAKRFDLFGDEDARRRPVGRGPLARDGENTHCRQADQRPGGRSLTARSA